MLDPLNRWRLLLGRYAEKRLGPCEDTEALQQLAVLDWLYGRGHEAQGVRQPSLGGLGGATGGEGGDEASALSVPSWLNEVRQLFPTETSEIVTKHALERFGLTELVTDPEILRSLTPSVELLSSLLAFKGLMQGRVLEEARRLIRSVVEELSEKLKVEVHRAFAGRVDRFTPSRLRVHQNLDWKRTLRRNLKNWDAHHKRLVLSELHYFSRVQRRLPWTVILCVDQSGSMVASVIHSAVMAGILAGLPSVTPKLVVFDTSIVDLSDRVEDPVELLMSVQLGGGTDIGGAVCYCEKLVEDPRRSVFVLVSDFEEGGSPATLIGAVNRMQEAGVTLIGLAALDSMAVPSYDHKIAARLADAGMEIAALTPRRLAEWLAKVMQ